MYPGRAESGVAASETAHPQRHVLVVDDERELADQLAHGLSILGFAVAVVYSASDARLQLAARPDIVVVITDVRLAGEEGLALAEDIFHETDELRARGVVVISGNASAEDAARAERAGASDFLTKPFRLHEIAKAVEVAAKQAEARRLQARGRHTISASLPDGEVSREDLTARLEQVNAELAPQIASGAVPPEVAQCVTEVSQWLRASGAALSPVSDGREAPLKAWRDIEEGMVRLEELVRAYGPAVSGPQNDLELGTLATEILNRVAQAYPDCTLRMEPNMPAIAVHTERCRLERILELCIEVMLSHTAHSNALRMRLSSVPGGDGDWACLTLQAGLETSGDELPAGLPQGDEGGPLASGVAALQFFSARRLAKLEGGALSSRMTPSGFAALRLSLPVQRIA